MPELRVRRDDPIECELVDADEPERLDSGQALLRVERFALSANNVSYAEMGDRLGYWRLFPAADGWGRIPAWGYARVARSEAEGVEEGLPVFGLVPMGSHLTVRPAAQPFGFIDRSSHRSELSPVYNSYLRVGEDAGDLELVMRPLFSTSVVLDLILGEEVAGAGGSVVLTSASSKTAIGLAHLLHGRSVPTIGLTSERNLDWLAGLDLYERLIAYPDAAELARAGAPAPTAVVDFAGDPELLGVVHGHLEASLDRSLLVGFTHRGGIAGERSLPGPAPEFFFAPDEIVRRGSELAERYVSEWPGFADLLEESIEIEEIDDGGRLTEVHRDLYAGEVEPSVAYVASL